VIGLRERTAAELLEFVVYLSSTETMAIGAVSLFVVAVANRKRGAVHERPHWEETQEGLH